ncbi:MAG TPA: protein-(glutamine-N5) methyltransferase, release factor-specific, partial [Pseudoxanthomonas sp.]|nr:protein-(glutamine-N5) methyltransferase, release factor-specific [Pseudoxanthomonas sp.]
MDDLSPPSVAPVRVDALLREAAARIGREDAEPLLVHALGVDRAWLFAHAGDPVGSDAAGRYRALVARREAGEPVAYLTWRRGF